jgi:sulfite exporter TauE/SafE
VISLLLTGILGSLHCVGMCGGFVLALERPSRRPWARLAAPAAFLLGKACTYVCLGAAAGLLGGALAGSGAFRATTGVLAVVAGTLMVYAGLQVAGILRELPVSRWFGPDSWWGRAVRAVSEARGPAAPFAMGAFVGLLPCPLVYAFLAAAVATGSVLRAMLTMAILGLASAPALALVGLLGATVSPLARRRATQVAGVVIVLLGVVTFLRGVAPDLAHRAFGHFGTPL